MQSSVSPYRQKKRRRSIYYWLTVLALVGLAGTVFYQAWMKPVKQALSDMPIERVSP